MEEEYQDISGSLSVPIVSVSSEILELASNNRPGGDSLPNEDIQHLCDPTTGVEKTEKKTSGEIENGTYFGARSTSSPKLHLNCMNPEKRTVTNTAENSMTGQCKEVKEGGKSSRDFVSTNLKLHNGSPCLQRGQGRSDSGDKMKSTRPFYPVPKKESALDNHAGEGRKGIQAEGWKDQVPEQEHMYDKTSRTHLSPRMQHKSRSPVLQHSACQRGHIQKSIVTPRLSPRLQRHNCIQIEEEGFRAHNQAATNIESGQNRFVKISKESFGVEKRPRSPSSPNLRVNNTPGLRGRSWSFTNQMPKTTGEVEVNSLSTSPRRTPLRKKRDLSKPESLNTQAWETECFSKEKERVCLSNTEEITGATSPSPQLKHRGKSMPFLDCKVSQIAMNSRDRITKKDQGNNGQSVSQAGALSKGPKMLQKRGWEVPNSLPQSEKLEMPVEAADQPKCPNVTIEVVESQGDNEKVGFSDIEAQLSLPVNQPNSHLSVISVRPLHRRSTGDIHEACLRDDLPVNYSNGYEMRSPEMRRLSVQNRASSMSELHESSNEKKTFSSITAFNLATQNPAGHKTAVKFREITEPVRKSKWFHALTNVVNLNYFQVAMMEIQKQKERDKASEENRPSMEKTFEEIKNCRYLRVPEHYQ